MNVTTEVEFSLQTRHDLIELVKTAADYLASRDHAPDSPVTATWRLYPHHDGRPRIALGLVDEDYSRGMSFSPDQLTPADVRELRLLGVWNDLLRARSHRDLARMNQLISQAEEG